MAKNLLNNVKTIETWGIKFNPITFSDFIHLITLRIQFDLTPIHITGVNPETVVHASKHNLIRKSINDSDLVNIDNYLIVAVLRLKGYNVPCRIATPDLFEALLDFSNRQLFKIFILGSKQTILEKALKNINSRYPNIKVSGQNGYFSLKEERGIVSVIKNFNPDMVFIAMPSPYKESFILKFKSEINAKVYLGIGGAIDVKAGRVKRAPKIFREIGLEGLHRCFQNPFNYGIRVFRYYPEFIKIVFKNGRGKED